MNNSQQSRHHRHRRIRASIIGTAERPRLVVFRSLKHISAQLIDDTVGRTIASADDRQLEKAKGKKVDLAKAVGTLIAKKATEAKITSVIFDRGGYQFHGRIRALADGAREGGLTF